MLTSWLPIIAPIAAAVLFAFLSVYMEQTQNKQPLKSAAKPQQAGQKKTV